MITVIYFALSCVAFLILLKVAKYHGNKYGYYSRDLEDAGMTVFACFAGCVIWPVLLMIVPMAYFGKWYFNREEE